MALKVIDVSYHNGKIDWAKVKASGVDGAIIRCGYGDNYTNQDDEQWERNADECTRLGIPFGTYIYSYAKSESQARSEAEHVLRLVKGYKLSYPVYYDLEEAGTQSGAVNRMKIFAEIIENAGYWVGVYCNKSWWDNTLKSLGDRYTKWIARYNSTLGMSGVDMWQYTSSGSVSGISGRVDMNHCYRDFPKEISGSSSSSPSGSSSTAPSGDSGYDGNSIVDYLKSIGKDSSFAARKQYASQYGISNYTGTAAQNSKLLSLMRGGSSGTSSSGSSGGYYPAFSSSSIVDGLKSIGVDSSMSNRKKIAAANGISVYTGTAAQNTKLCSLAKQGKLKKVGSSGSGSSGSSYYAKFNSASIVDGLKSIGVDSSMANRKKIAAANGISGYTGTAAQNNKLCALAKQGKLKKA